jgi:hypothetical protein
MVIRMTDDEKAAILQRTHEVLDDAARTLAEAAEREAHRDPLAEDALERWERLRQQSQEPPPRVTAASKRPAMTKNERNEMLAIVAAMIRREISQALTRREASIADAIGKALAEERAAHRKAYEALAARVVEFEQRALDTAPVLDLRAERDRRRGGSAT